MRLCLIRHGQSQANVDDQLYLTIKDHDIQLTDLGKSQAVKAGHNLFKLLSEEKTNLKGTLRVFVSPYTRTRQTWDGIKSAQCPVVHLPRMEEEESVLLREKEYKIFADHQEMKQKKEKRNSFGPFWYRFKNAESDADVFLRVSTFWNQLTNRFLLGEIQEEDTVVIVAHEVTLRMIMMLLKRTTYETSKFDIHNCEILTIHLTSMSAKYSGPHRTIPND